MAEVNTGALNAAVQAAVKVAPVKGGAYDSAAGILFRTEGDELEVRATDLDTTFQEYIPIDDTSFEARLPASVLSGMLSTLNPDSHTTLQRQGDKAIIRCGKVVAELNHIMGEYPQIGGFDWNDAPPLSRIPDFAASVKRVAWGAGRRGEAPYDGIHFDHKGIVTTDKASFVQLGFDLGISETQEGITVPLTSVSAVVPSSADCRVAVDGNRLRICAAYDERTVWLTSNVYAQKFPPIDKVRGFADTDNHFLVDRAALESSVRRLIALVGTERYPRIRMMVKDDELDMEITHAGTGQVSDTLPVDQVGEDIEIHMAPERVLNAARSITVPVVRIGHHAHNMRPLVFTGEDGDDFLYVAMPMAPPATQGL